MRRQAVALATALSLAAALPAAAQSGSGPEKGFWPEGADGDGNGSLSQSEIQALSGQSFARHDQNEDGVVTLDEWMVMVQERLDRAVAEGRVNKQTPDQLTTLFQESFAKQDRDGDGRITRAEWDFLVQAHFAQLDADGDGEVSREEAGARYGLE